MWTDGYLPINFTATDAHGMTVGPITDTTGCDFSCGDGNPSHFRFFGVIDPAGISSIHIDSGATGGIEVDHLQFGLQSANPVPEPSAAIPVALLTASFFLTRTMRRRFRA